MLYLCKLFAHVFPSFLPPQLGRAASSVMAKSFAKSFQPCPVCYETGTAMSPAMSNLAMRKVAAALLTHGTASEIEIWSDADENILSDVWSSEPNGILWKHVRQKVFQIFQ